MACLFLLGSVFGNALKVEVKNDESNIVTTMSDSMNFYSSTTDGGIIKWGDNYNDAWTSTTGGVGQSLDNFTLGHSAAISQPFNIYVFYVVRSFVFFDTSSLPNDANIVSATLSLYGKEIGVSDDFNIVIQKGNEPYPHEPLVSTDFNKNNYNGNLGSYDAGSFTTSGYNHISLNSEGENHIDKDGTTKLCLRVDREIAGEDPWDGESNGYFNHVVRFYSSDKGGSYRPKLTVEYTTGGGGGDELDVQTKDASNVDSDSATLNGKIIDDGGEDCQVRFRYKIQGEGVYKPREPRSKSLNNIQTESNDDIGQLGNSDWIYASGWEGSHNTGDSFSKSINGLQSDVCYEFQAGAKNSQGTDWGSTKQFTTSSGGGGDGAQCPIWAEDHYWIYNFDFDFKYSVLDVVGSISNLKLRVDSIDETCNEYKVEVTGSINADMSIAGILPGGGFSGTLSGFAYYDRSNLALKNVNFESFGWFSGIETIIDFSMAFSPAFDIFDFPINPSEDINNPWEAETFAEINGDFKFGVIPYSFNIPGSFEGEVIHYVAQEQHQGYDCIKISGNMGPDNGGSSELWYSSEVGYLVDIQEEIFGWEGVDATLSMQLTSTNFQTNNKAPNPPSRPSGETTLTAGMQYTYTSSTTDPEGDSMYYQFDWGDGTESEWLGPYSNGQTVSASHSWRKTGTSNIRVKAKDDNIVSLWSSPLSVNVLSSMPTTDVTLYRISNYEKDDIDVGYPWDGNAIKPEWYYEIEVITNIDEPDEKSSTTFLIENRKTSGVWNYATTWTPNNLHKLLSYGPEVVVRIKVMDHDEWYEWGDDLADVSGCKNDGVDNDVSYKRGAIYHCKYNLVTNQINPYGYSSKPSDYSDYYTFYEEWYMVAGDQKSDKSTNYDGNDALVLFSLSDSYEKPTANIEPFTDVLRPNTDIQFLGSVGGGVSSAEKPYQWHWNFDDGSTSNQQNPIHRYTQDGEYDVKLTVTDGFDQTDSYTLTIEVVENAAPVKPNAPQGPTKGSYKKSHIYTASTTDPDDDDIYYKFSWGDGSESSWIGPFASGTEVQETHKWSRRGTYSVKVKAKDINGKEGPWSNPTSAQMPKTSSLFDLFDGRFINLIKQFFSFN